MPAEAADKPVIVWFRRDLRLEANPAWAAATTTHRRVVAAYVLEPALLAAAGDMRRNQFLAHLAALDAQLRTLGGNLVVRPGPAADALASLTAETGASDLYYNNDVTPFSRRRDAAVSDAVDVTHHRFWGNLVHEPGRVLTAKGTLSQVFTPFHKSWARAHVEPWPEPGPGVPMRVHSAPIPPPDGPVAQAPGPDAAWARLTAWLDQVDGYPETRDLPAVDGTSELSADLKFGTLSARTVLDVVGTDSPGRAAFVRQLAWRDWYAHILAQRQDLAISAVNEVYNHIGWRDDDDGFQAWCDGRTGYPIVDAGMRQLVASGWMHNRVRMITASFLVKDLLVDWRRGERFFRHHLVDADLAQNAGNWQWVAGTGPDAAPYFRIFNPTSQSRKFDPDGDYIRRWVPELAGLPSGVIHEPVAAGPLEAAAAGVTLGDTYPFPIVDHKAARERTLAAYKAVRS